MVDQKLHDMIETALAYCQLIESVDRFEREEWLQQMADLLPRLHDAMTALDLPLDHYVRKELPDYDDRFTLFTRLYTVLGERDGYWRAFDTAHDGQRLSGSLADDFTDIYFDLKQGLQLLRANPSEPTKAANDWRYSYHMHWGHHLADAARQLTAMGARHQLDS